MTLLYVGAMGVLLCLLCLLCLLGLLPRRLLLQPGLVGGVGRGHRRRRLVLGLLPPLQRPFVPLLLLLLLRLGRVRPCQPSSPPSRCCRLLCLRLRSRHCLASGGPAGHHLLLLLRCSCVLLRH